MDIGSNGLIQLNLIIPRGTSFDFDIELQDESGEYISLENATFACKFEKDFMCFDITPYVTGTSKGLRVSIPFETTSTFPLGVMLWDLLVYTSETECFKMANGKVKIVDTISDGDCVCC